MSAGDGYVRLPTLRTPPFLKRPIAVSICLPNGRRTLVAFVAGDTPSIIGAGIIAAVEAAEKD
jgi:hypothetical protein